MSDPLSIYSSKNSNPHMIHLPDVHIANAHELERKLSRFSSGNIEIRADFDGTMTLPKPTTWQLLEQLEPHLPGYTERTRSLYGEYHPYMHSTDIDSRIVEQKIGEWWEKSLGVFREMGVHRDHLDTIGVEHVGLRNGISEAFSTFESWGTPVLVVSAGIGQMIDKILSRHELTGEHIRVIANRLDFAASGEYEGISPEVHIHSSNKHFHIPANHKVDSYKERQILLLGDSPQDMSMIDRHERENTLAIAFSSPGNIGAFRDFDITVVSGDSDNGVLERIIAIIEGRTR